MAFFWRFRAYFLIAASLGIFLTQAFAEEALTHHKKDLLIDGFYPPYPEIKPTQDKVTDALIERGEYLAKMGDCIACHTNVKEGTAPYAGGLPLATPFGTFYSPNITPDKETGIGKWTEEDFIRALKKGRDPKGHNYFPVFPYIYFSKITDEDAKALYTYFMHIPPVKQKNKSLPFPFNMPGARFSLWGWNILFFFPHAKQFKYNPEQNNEWNRGRYIVEGLGHCGMCHTPLTIFGSPKRRYYLTGSFVDGYWAPNITKYGLISATHQDVADVFSTHELINEAGPVVGPMAEVNHNSLQHMTPEDRLAIATFLKTVISTEPLAFSPSEAKPSIQRGKAVYYKVCEICHQEGKMSAPRNGDSANWYLRLKSSGLSGLYRHTINGYNSMPVKGACVTCSDNDLISAVDYLLNNSLTRSQWDNLKKGGKRAFPSTGKEVYFDSCALCHNSGKEGAPRIGDKEKWDALVKQNVDVLFANTMHSRVHPQNGGCAECSSDEILEAIKYILSQSTTTGNYSLW